VLDIATRQINRRGVVATLLADVAREIGVTRMAMYQHVADREDLVFQCYLRSCDILDAEVASAAEIGGALDQVRTLILRLLGPEAPELCAIVEPGLLPKDKYQEVEGRFDAVVAAIVALLEAGRHAGEIRDCDFDVVARALINTLFWVPLAALWNRRRLGITGASILQSAESLFLDGWASDRAAPIDYEPLDLDPLTSPVADAFDRAAVNDAKRERILAAASAQFNRKGIDSTTLEDIAAAIGATPRTLYHNVGDKETLVAECYFRMMRMGIHLQSEALKRPGQKLPSHIAFIHAWARTQMRQDLSPLMPLTGFEMLSPEHQARYYGYADELTVLVLAHIQQGVVDGSIRPMGTFATTLQAGVLGWLTRSSFGADEQEHVAYETAMLLAIGIRAIESAKDKEEPRAGAVRVPTE
jgi:AcrR family transcriptional regulator